MPRKKVDGKPVKRRSRGGCHNCKRLKIKCNEQKPRCGNCVKHDIKCDYSLILSWGGRPIRKDTSKTDLTNGVVLEQIANINKVFVPVPYDMSEGEPFRFVIENPAEDEEELLEDCCDSLQLVHSNNHNNNTLTNSTNHPRENNKSIIEQFAADLETVERLELPSIIKELSPLPDMIKSVPFYRELYYYFLNVTADKLVPVPHTFYPDNPFRTVLPRIAVDTPHLLSLILAYAAAHRAKYLRVPEPVETLSNLLSTTFEGLTKSLTHEDESKSDATLATAIMLASYEMLWTNVNDSWKTHLQGAREIVMARGITDSWTLHERPASIAPFHPTRLINTDLSRNEASYFLLRCFAYMDVISALCSPDASSVFINNDDVYQWSSPVHTKNKHSEVDYMLGVDLNMIPVFSRVAALARKRKKETLTEEQEQELNNEATQLSETLISAGFAAQPIGHEYDDDGYESQLRTMNAMFCYATLIHLYRRVLLLPAHSASVQTSVELITSLLERLPQASGIYACIAFPIVTAGCEVSDPEVREKYRNWITWVQRHGVGHAFKGKDLMELSWATNKHWTDLMGELGWDLVFM